jgi:hypothetical protein
MRRNLETRTHLRIVEAEPARPVRRHGGIGGDDLKKHAVAQSHQMIARPHQRMCAARRHHHAEGAPHVSDAFLKCQRSDGQMIQ